MFKSNVKNKLINSLFDSAIVLSKNPEIILNGDIVTGVDSDNRNNYDSFVVKNNANVEGVCVTNRTTLLIELNYSQFIKLNEVSRAYVIMWCGFNYFSDFLRLVFFGSGEMEVDSETIKYLLDKEVITEDNVNKLISDISVMVSSGGESARTVKRIRNIINSLNKK